MDSDVVRMEDFYPPEPISMGDFYAGTLVPSFDIFSPSEIRDLSPEVVSGIIAAFRTCRESAHARMRDAATRRALYIALQYLDRFDPITNLPEVERHILNKGTRDA